MTREQLAQVYIDWRNDYLTISKFAEDYGLYDSEAEMLLNLARQCYENPHPEA